MIAFAVVMRHEVGDRTVKRGLSEEDHSVQALRLYRVHEALRECIQIRRSRRQSNEVDALTDEDITKLVCVFCISVEYQIPRVAKEADLGIGDIARNLCHSSIVGMRRDASNVDRAGGNVDEEEDVVRHQPPDRVYLNAQEVGRCQAFPVGFEKRRPSSMAVSLRSRLDAVFSEDVGDGASANLMTQISQRAADSRVSPGGIVLRHAQNEIHDCLHDAGPPRPAPSGVVPL
jgi:hypothetical protein